MSTFESVPPEPLGAARSPHAWLSTWPPTRVGRGRGNPRPDQSALPPPLPPAPAPAPAQPAADPAVGGNPVTVTVQFTVYGEDAFATAAAVADRLRPIVRAAEPIRLDQVTAYAEDHQFAVRQDGEHAPAPLGRLAALPVLPLNEGDAPLRILSAGYRAELDGTPLALTRREYDLLLFLAEHPGQVFTRVQLLQTVWQQAFVSGQRTIDVHVRRLRAKLGERGPRIATVRGVGYRLDAPDRVSVVREPG